MYDNVKFGQPVKDSRPYIIQIFTMRNTKDALPVMVHVSLLVYQSKAVSISIISFLQNLCLVLEETLKY